METMMKIINALSALTAALQEFTEQTTNGYLGTFEEIYNPEKDKPQEETQEPDAPVIDRISVRAKLSTLTRNGYSDAVKELLRNHGADRLSAVPDEELPALMKEAELIGA